MELSFCLYLIDLVLYDTTMICFFFTGPWNPFWGFRFNKIDQELITVLVIP